MTGSLLRKEVNRMKSVKLKIAAVLAAIVFVAVYYYAFC